MKFAFESSLPTPLLRTQRDTGECVVQKRVERDAVVYELIVNGKLLMDSREHASEVALADIALRECRSPALSVLVGGLGFGFTLQAVLRDARVTHVTVVELEPLLATCLKELAIVDVADPRVVLQLANVCDAIAAASNAYDAILLDVDNGPESLSAAGNEKLYSEAGLLQCRNALRPGGVLAIWSSEPSATCLRRLAACFDDAREWIVRVQRDRRHIDYRIFTGSKP